jgi:hypothetical protein
LEEEDGKGRGNEAVWCGTDLRERVCGELRDGEELVLGDEALGAAVELAEALVERHDLLLRDFTISTSDQGSSIAAELTGINWGFSRWRRDVLLT